MMKIKTINSKATVTTTASLSRTLLSLAALATVCVSSEQVTPAVVEIVKQNSEVDVNGYHFEFETSDGTSRQEHGVYKNDTEQQGLAVNGSYKYVAPDGQQITVTFVADKNGYQPKETNDVGQKSSQK